MAVFLSGAQNLTGASHDSLDVAKMGGSRIRRLDKVGVLGRGGRGWKEGRRGKLQRWADMALQVTRVSGELDREGVRKRGGGGGLAATAATAKIVAKKKLPKYEWARHNLNKAVCCCAQLSAIHKFLFRFYKTRCWVDFPQSRIFLAFLHVGHTCINSNTSLSSPGSCSCHARALLCFSSHPVQHTYTDYATRYPKWN